MKNSTVLFIVLVCCASAFAQKAPAQNSADLKAIQELEQADAAAAKINDAQALTSLWADDGVLIQPMSPPLIGRSAIHSLLVQQSQNAPAKMAAYTEDWKERQVFENRAFEWGTISATIELPNGKQVSQTIYAARFLVRSRDGRWLFSRVILSPAPRSLEPQP